MPEDERFLQRALTLAREAAAFASPNPTVGCVLARSGQVIGEGAHFYDNRDHAEIAALKQAKGGGHLVEGSTAYVTLEPCAHYGRTGPCAVALVAARIARCVIATVDPNPQVSGQGIAILRGAGVDVRVMETNSLSSQNARRLNDAFAFAIQRNRPFVTLKTAVSSDGYLAPPPGARTRKEPYWLTGSAARADVQALRHGSDAVLTGIGTVHADDPSLTDRTGLIRHRRLVRILLDSKLRIPLESVLLSTVDHDLLIATSQESPVDREDVLRSKGADVARLRSQPAAGLDLNVLLELLHERHIRSVLLEAGSALNASFLAADLVDRVIIYRSGKELGPSAIPFAAGQITVDGLERRLSERSSIRIPRHDDLYMPDVRIQGYLHDPWQGVS